MKYHYIHNSNKNTILIISSISFLPCIESTHTRKNYKDNHLKITHNTCTKKV